MLNVYEINLNSKLDRILFVDFVFKLANQNKNWRPGLRMILLDIINPAKNPFLQSYKMRLFVLLDGGNVVARAGFVQSGYLKEYPDAGLLVFPDFVDDFSVFDQLTDHLCKVSAQSGCTSLIGPFNPNIHYDVGIQLSGFDLPNAAFMGYQPAYYSKYFERKGFTKVADFFSWHLDMKTWLNKGKLAELENKILSNPELKIRPLNLKKFKDELKLFHHLYSESFKNHWGFRAPDFNEFEFIAGDLKYILSEKLAFVAEYKGTPVGFALGIPDLYEALEKKHNGRLNILSIISLLRKRKGIKNTRVMIAGVLPEFRHLGIHVPLFMAEARNIFESGFDGGQIAWVMDGNSPMTKTLQLMGAVPKQQYRLYQVVC